MNIEMYSLSVFAVSCVFDFSFRMNEPNVLHVLFKYLCLLLNLFSYFHLKHSALVFFVAAVTVAFDFISMLANYLTLRINNHRCLMLACENKRKIETLFSYNTVRKNWARIMESFGNLWLVKRFMGSLFSQIICKIFA